VYFPQILDLIATGSCSNRISIYEHVVHLIFFCRSLGSGFLVFLVQIFRDLFTERLYVYEFLGIFLHELMFFVNEHELLLAAPKP
jgi:hypothetical protein